MNSKVETFFDPDTNTLSYIVYDNNTLDAIIIDPVLDYDPATSKVSKHSVKKLLNFINEKNLKIHYILETHPHADHITGAVELKKSFTYAKIAISKEITKVQSTFKGIFNFKSLATNGEQFDQLLCDGEVISAGEIKVKAISTPGHTPACSSFLIDDMIFTGDALFMPDAGTGRCDFPAGSSKDLYHSVHEKLYSLPKETRVYTGHDYQPQGRDLEFQSTIAQNMEANIQLNFKTSEEEFIKAREDRDATLSAPRLLLPSIQVNINAGKFPEAENNSVAYLKLPIKE